MMLNKNMSGSIGFTFLLVVLLVSQAPASVVKLTTIKDHISEPTLWQEVGLIDNFKDPTEEYSSVAAAVITGNGQMLVTVGIIWGKAKVDGEFNGGSADELRWVFRFFPEGETCSVSSLFTEPAQPNYQAVFDTPSNPDWNTVVGQCWGTDLYYAEVDVSSLNIVVPFGQVCKVALVPESKLASPQTIGIISFSTGGTSAIGAEPDWIHRGALLGGEGPSSLTEQEFPGDYFAYRITTIPALEPVLVVTPSTQNVPATSGTASFDISNYGLTDMNWTAEVITGGDWLTLSPTSGTNAETITVTVAANSGEERTATIRITAADAIGSPMDVTVVQAKQNLLVGDCDGNGKVDYADFVTLKSNFGRTNMGWAQGDFDGNNKVDYSDFVSLKANFGKTGGVSASQMAQFQAAAEAFEAAFAPKEAAQEAQETVQSTVPCSPLGMILMSIVGLALYSLSSWRTQEESI